MTVAEPVATEYSPLNDLRTMLAELTSPVPVSVNNGIDLTSAVISADVE